MATQSAYTTDQWDGQEALLEVESEPTSVKPVRLVEIQRSAPTKGYAQDTGWHPEMYAGMQCPTCQKHVLVRNHNTLFCGFCRERWWVKKRVYMLYSSQ